MKINIVSDEVNYVFIDRLAGKAAVVSIDDLVDVGVPIDEDGEDLEFIGPTHCKVGTYVNPTINTETEIFTLEAP